MTTMNRQQRRAESKQLNTGKPSIQAMYTAALHHHNAGELEEAGRLYRKVLAINPRHADSLHLLGVALHQQGDCESAITPIRQAVAISGSVALYHLSLGGALKDAGRLAEAAGSYRRSIALWPGNVDAQTQLGITLRALGDLPAAEVAFRAACGYAPGSAEAHSNLGAVLKEQGKLEEASGCFGQAIALAPDYADAHNNFGTVLADMGRLDEAVARYQRALALQPDFAEAHNNLGAALDLQGELEAAVPHFQRAIERAPNFTEAHTNLGVALGNLRRLDEAVACYRRALAIKPDFAEAHLYLATTLLAQGEMAAGWAEYEWRWKTRQLGAGGRSFAQALWRGEAAPGRTVLIHAEQGFGDTLQFCRYAPMAAARGVRVVLEVQKPLVRLLRALPGIAQVVGQGEALPHFDLHAPLMSLPWILGSTLETLPGTTPYLQAEAAEVAHWRGRLAEIAPVKKRVGLVWAGNPRRDSPVLAAVDRRRSMPPEKLARLGECQGVTFFSLQKDSAGDCGDVPMVDVMGEMADFAATAALIANLDLVISVDTAVAHLAAALGKPVWLLNRFDSCWRWLDERRDSPWYPSLRLYNQPRPGDWESVMGDVVGDLRKEVEG
jgi:tetratricopeptide (TPR) repeat protein